MTTNTQNLSDNVYQALLSQLGGHDPEKVLAHIRLVTENIYQKLPSGDYGRGDVRLAIEKWAEDRN